MRIITTNTDSTGRPATGAITVTVDGEQHRIDFSENGVADVDDDVGEALVEREDLSVERFDQSTVDAYEEALPDEETPEATDGDDGGDEGDLSTEQTPPKRNAEETPEATDVADERADASADEARSEAGAPAEEARPAAETETVADPVDAGAAEGSDGPAGADDAPLEPGDYSVDELEQELADQDLDAAQLEAVAAAERTSDSPRSTALEAIERAIDEAEADPDEEIETTDDTSESN